MLSLCGAICQRYLELPERGVGFGDLPLARPQKALGRITAAPKCEMGAAVIRLAQPLASVFGLLTYIGSVECSEPNRAIAGIVPNVECRSTRIPSENTHSRCTISNLARTPLAVQQTWLLPA
jgi:hypothetical protein